MITPGDIDDREPLKYEAFMNLIYGKLVGDKDYIRRELFQRLFVNGIQLITKLKSNMKGALMSVSYILLLRKRAITLREKMLLSHTKDAKLADNAKRRTGGFTFHSPFFV